MIRSNPSNFCLLFLSYVPNISSTSEQKTKITQMGVKELRNIGLFPDIIIARTTSELKKDSKEKIALFSGLKDEYVIGNQDVKHLLEVVVNLEE